MLLALLGLALAAPLTDDGVRARIEALRPTAEALVIDGRSDDWGELFTMRGADDIEGIAVAPTEDYLAVLVTLGPQADPLRPVLVSVDTGGAHPLDTILKVHGSTVFVNWHEGKRFRPLADAVSARQGRVVELRVAWATLKAEAPEDHAVHSPRGWVRVRAQQARADGDRRTTPLAVASYRLTFPPPPLDDPIPEPEAARVDGQLPLEGTWFVTQGAQSDHGSHSDAWAYDLVIRDRTHRARLGKELADTLAWGRPVVSPARGTVRLAIDEHPDRPLGAPKPDGEKANKVIVDLDDRTRFRVGHLQQGSVAVAAGDRVLPGKLLGRVGNSGASSGPHAHVVHTHADGRPAPVRWHGVTVQLNPVADDPWARTPTAGWEPRGGWFVTQLPRASAVPTAIPAPLPD